MPGLEASPNAVSEESSDILVKLIDNEEPSPIPMSAFTELRSSITGKVVLASNTDYESLRAPTWNYAIQPYPVAIVVPWDVTDVCVTVKWAAKLGIEVTVAGGRHTVHSSKNGRVTLDLSAMHSIIPDPSNNTVHVQGGARLGELDRACSRYGVATVAGTNPDTGIGGYSVGGGWGYLSRQKGMTVDNLMEVEAVLANGDVGELAAW